MRFRRACLLVAALLIAGVVSAPVVAAAPVPSCADEPGNLPTVQPFRVCASFDATSYQSNQPITLTLTMTDLGTQPALGVHILFPSGFSWFMPRQVFTGVGPGFTSEKTGIDIAPGATVTATGIGYAADVASGTVEMSPGIFQRGQGSGIAPVARASVTQAPPGDYSGQVYTAQPTATGAPGPHVGLAGVRVFLVEMISNHSVTAVTNASGQFSFTNLPGGPYELEFDTTATPPWVIQTAGLTVVAIGQRFALHPQFLARPPEATVLTASGSFDQPSYTVGDTAAMSISLTNLTSRPLSGIHVFCPPIDQIHGVGPGWAPFDDSSGAVVLPGTTVFHVSEPVTAVGTALLNCRFGLLDVTGNPDTFAVADVSG